LAASYRQPASSGSAEPMSYRRVNYRIEQALLVALR